mgnify:CR=1 FL=1
MEELFGRGRLPGELMERWPKDAQGAPVPPAFLTHCGSTDLADVILVNMLEAYDIPVMILHPGDGDFGKVVLGLSGTGSRIYVPETLYEQAKELMEAEPNDDI